MLSNMSPQSVKLAGGTSFQAVRDCYVFFVLLCCVGLCCVCIYCIYCIVFIVKIAYSIGTF